MWPSEPLVTQTHTHAVPNLPCGAGADMLEKNVIRKFRRVFAAMLDQEMSELRQLDHIHQRRVLEKLHAKSERARKMLEYASQEGDPKVRRW